VNKTSRKLADRLNKLIDDAVALRPQTGHISYRKPKANLVVAKSSKYPKNIISMGLTLA
jgi:hypothetical protein